jgi:uncharacterized protein
MTPDKTEIADDVVQQDMRRWLERAVIGLNLCPFAKAVHVKEQIHYAVSAATTPKDFLEDIVRELQELNLTDPDIRSTTLVMAPHCLDDFLEFNDFLSDADDALFALELDGILQIASFHPDFQFAGTSKTDITNATNRAPYPTLHLLREDEVDEAVKAFPEAATIFEKNIDTLEALGIDGWKALSLGRSQP